VSHWYRAVLVIFKIGSRFMTGSVLTKILLFVLPGVARIVGVCHPLIG
jgi:hypothetical protein